MILTTPDKTRLRALGIYVYDVFESTGECIVEAGGVQYRERVAHLKRLARPSIIDRLRSWISGEVA